MSSQPYIPRSGCVATSSADWHLCGTGSDFWLVQLQVLETHSVCRQGHASKPGARGHREARASLTGMDDLLATSINTRSLFLIPKQIENPWVIANKLGKALDPETRTNCSSTWPNQFGLASCGSNAACLPSKLRRSRARVASADLWISRRVPARYPGMPWRRRSNRTT